MVVSHYIWTKDGLNSIQTVPNTNTFIIRKLLSSLLNDHHEKQKTCGNILSTKYPGTLRSFLDMLLQKHYVFYLVAEMIH